MKQKPSAYFKQAIVQQGKKKFNSPQKRVAEFFDEYHVGKLTDEDREMLDLLAEVTTSKNLKIDIGLWSIELAKKVLNEDEYRRAMAMMARMTVVTKKGVERSQIGSIDLGNQISYLLSQFLMLIAIELDENDSLPADPEDYTNSQCDFRVDQDGDLIPFEVRVHGLPDSIFQIRKSNGFVTHQNERLFKLMSEVDMSSDATKNRILRRDTAHARLAPIVDIDDLEAMFCNDWMGVSAIVVDRIIRDFKEPGDSLDIVLDHYKEKYPEFHEEEFKNHVGEIAVRNNNEAGFAVPLVMSDCDYDFVMGFFFATGLVEDEIECEINNQKFNVVVG